MKILAIRFARLGDVILLLPALTSIKASLPHAHVTLLTGHRCAPIAEMCPALGDVIPVDRIAMRDGPIWHTVREMKDLVSNIRARRFDAVVDYHSFRETNLLALFSSAPMRLGMRRVDAAYFGFCFNRPPVLEDKTLHVSQMFQRVSEALPGVCSRELEGPTLRIPENVQSMVSASLPPGPRLALYVDAPVPDRRWPPEFFAVVADYAAEELQAQSIVLSSPAGAAAVHRVKSASRYPEKVHVFTDQSLSALAASIKASTLLISNDTGPMHLGPALGVPTIGLFSVGLPEHFRPIGPTDRFLRNFPIEGLSAERVIQELRTMWTTVGRDLQR